MPLYENASCPVCNKAFEQGDDIVYCPECGTPHHRECYASLGHCGNADLHAEGYNFYDDYKSKATDGTSSEAAPFPPVTAGGSTDNRSGAGTSFNPFGPIAAPPEISTPFDNDASSIDGESTSDVAAAVRTNAKRFVPLFKEMSNGKRKFSWNWGAFFFGPYYYFYRKMYKQGTAFLCVNFALSLLSSVLISKLAPASAKVLMELQKLLSTVGNNQAALTAIQKKYEQLFSTSDARIFTIITIAEITASLVVGIIATICADRFYKATVLSVVKRVKAQLQEGATFQASPLSQRQDISLSQEQMKRIYLSARGGTNIFAPLVIFLLWEILMMFL